MLNSLRRRWACLLLLLLTVVDLVVPDPLPFVDEAILVGLTGLCFRRHRSKNDGDGESGPDLERTDGD